jgi:parallel beta-helix repeat protein
MPGNGMGGGLQQEGKVLVSGVEIDHNGSTAGLGDGSSGIKFAGSGGSTIRDSYVHDNIGNGIWFDVDSGGGDLIENNLVVGNSRRGIFYEVSRGPVLITGNEVRGNNTSKISGASGIGVSSGKNVTIEQNFIRDNFVWDMRFGEVSRPDINWDYPLSNVLVRNNNVSMTKVSGCGQDGVQCTNNVVTVSPSPTPSPTESPSPSVSVTPTESPSPSC